MFSYKSKIPIGLALCFSWFHIADGCKKRIQMLILIPSSILSNLQIVTRIKNQRPSLSFPENFHVFKSLCFPFNYTYYEKVMWYCHRTSTFHNSIQPYCDKNICIFTIDC